MGQGFTKVGPMKLPSRIGQGNFDLYLYQFGDNRRYFALEKGDVRQSENPLVRVESNCVWAHVFGSARCDCAEQTHESMRRIEKEGVGLLVHAYDQDGRGITVEEHIRVYMFQDMGFDTVEADKQAGFSHYDRRDYNDVIKILKDFELAKFRLLTNNPHRLEEINKHFTAQRVPIEAVELDKWNAAQLFIKKKKMGHMYSFDIDSPKIKALAERSIKGECKSEYTGPQQNR